MPPKNTKWITRPSPRNGPRQPSRPPGLKGREIGLFYKNLRRENREKKKKEQPLVYLNLPQNVITGLYKCLENIEHIAMINNIYLPPVKELKFITPPQKSDDVVFVNNKEPEVMEILDSSSEDITEASEDKDSDSVKTDDSIEPGKPIKTEEPAKFSSMEPGKPIKTEEPARFASMELGKPIKTEEPARGPSTEPGKSIKTEEPARFVSTKPGISIKTEEPARFASTEPDKPIKTEESARFASTEPDKSIKTEDSAKFAPTEPRKSIKTEDFAMLYPSAELSSSIKTEDFAMLYPSAELGTSIKTEDFALFACAEPGTSTANSTSLSSPSTSAPMNIENAGDTYKYGYDDIITGSFQEKLDECLAKGIEIAVENDETIHYNDMLVKNHHEMLSTNTKFKEMLKFRETLPTYKKAKVLLDLIKNHQVVVITGETGCGKSTQVPQLILDDAVLNGRGANIKILVTEPRRIAASSLASRVAAERGETPGTSVGYAVRLECVQSRKRGSIMFCTTGVLLVELEVNQGLTEYSHIILDEVHERDCNIDLAMCMLKQILEKRKDLKLILMSATIDARSLSDYFNHGQVVHIEGLAYAVQEVYLEDVVTAIDYKLPPPDHNDKFRFGRKPQFVLSQKEIQYRAAMVPWLKNMLGSKRKDVHNTLLDPRIEELNFELIVCLLTYLCQKEPGAILVFLPGISEISQLLRLMDESNKFPKSTHYIYTLHSKLPTIDQNLIFVRPPSHVRKIIIATNIAETSITIDDIVYVIDCGRMKYKGLDIERNFSTLQVEWISKANLVQRRGRAGRCQEGICFHLMMKYRAEHLDDLLPPEIQRTNLLEEVLCIKKLRLGKAAEALNMMPSVPAEQTIQWAIKHLQHIGALDETETLTPLGWHLARLPVHPAAGKLLLLGALFGCLDRTASVAAVWGFKDPFQFVLGKEDEANDAKRNFALGEPSDHLAMAEAIMQWEQCETNQEKQQFCYDTFISHKNVKLLSDMKKQFAGHLKQMGFLRQPDIRSPWANRNMDNLILFKALIAAALYPNIGTVRWINLKSPNPNKVPSIKVYTPEDGKIRIHPSSIMCSKVTSRGPNPPVCTNIGANWLVYWLKQKSTDLFLHDITCVYTLPLLFFGDLKYSQADDPNDCIIRITTMRVLCKKETAQLLFRLRSLLDHVLASKIGRSAGGQFKNFSQIDDEILNAVINLITAEERGKEYLDDEYYFDGEQDYEGTSY